MPELRDGTPYRLSDAADYGFSPELSGNAPLSFFSLSSVPVPPSTTPLWRSDCGYGSENAAYIGFQADRLCIFSVKTGFFGYRKLVPAVYLGKPRKAGTDVVCAVFVALFYEVVLVPQCRTRSDDRHLTGDYVEQLRKLVKRGFA